MPQMAPMMWLTLFMVFNMLLFVFMTNIYFSNNQPPTSTSIPLTSQSSTWMW